MKAIFTALLLLSALPLRSADESAPLDFLIFFDPRPSYLHLKIEKGEEVEARGPTNSLLIICWAPAPDGKFWVYQISGIDGYHSRERVDSFLKHFYEISPDKPGAAENIIIAGNNWGAGLELKEFLKPLSKVHSFDVYFAGSRAFKEVRFQREPADRLERIRKAFADSASEQKKE